VESNPKIVKIIFEKKSLGYISAKNFGARHLDIPCHILGGRQNHFFEKRNSSFQQFFLEPVIWTISEKMALSGTAQRI
jgi:hypothetical protein